MANPDGPAAPLYWRVESEFFHALDGVQVCWKPFSVHYEPPRWEDR